MLFIPTDVDGLKSVCDLAYERYGQETLKIIRDYEKDLSRYNKALLESRVLQE